ncbi:MAG: 16S rRNA (uracil(1498)-N(3))-methyltransferase [Thermodesulfovibrionales bacterium]
MRIFLHDLPADSPSATLRGDKARYLSLVLRCRPGDRLTVVASGNTARAAVVSSISRQTVVLDLGEPLGLVSTESPLRTILFQGLLKGDRMDLVVQKTTELGVAGIVPVVTERSQVRETRKLARWTKIAEEAARQSGRTGPPAVHDPMGFDEALSFFQRGNSPGIVFWEAGGAPVSAVFRQIGPARRLALFTGPEGGYSQEEITKASAAGIRAASLGTRILRAETASVMAVGLAQYELGDLSRPV